MELPSQSGLRSPKYTDSEDDESMNRAQIRKNNKPLLEKKRRARINSSLEQLKSLVLDALKKDSARHSKLEKADILEMTVKHLRELQRQQMAAAMTVDPSVVTKYQSGFGECAQEVQRYLGSIDGLSSEVRLRLMHHLNNCVNQVHQIASFGALPVYGGVPCASPTQSLPGIGLRPLVPFGGLAMTSSDSPSSLYGSGDYPRCESTLSPNSPSPRIVSSNTEPVRPLSEQSINLNHLGAFNRQPSPRRGDDNNNNVCAPPTKRQKIDRRKEVSENSKNNEQNLYDIKSEPVWRPW